MIDQPKKAGVGGSQTLLRGLDVVEMVAAGRTTLPGLAEGLGLTRSTAHRLASTLVERGYLAFTPRAGYRLGAKLLELGHRAHSTTDLIQVGRPHLEVLAEATGDTVHLGVLQNDQVLYLDKLPGRRRITIWSRVGDRQPLSSTGLGKALMLDHHPSYWDQRLAAERVTAALPVDAEIWRARMREYVATGSAYDLEENEDQIRCVAAPLRGAAGKIVGAISVSSAAQYMSDDRMKELSGAVVATAQAISRDLGWKLGKMEE